MSEALVSSAWGGEVRLYVFDQLDSTNRWLVEHMRNATAMDEMICIAASQSAGKGRSGRAWYSPAGENIYASFGVWPSIEVSKLPPLSLLTGLAVVESIQQLGIDAKLKWPNDVLVNNKKLGGVLIETVQHRLGTGLVVGIGLNLVLDTVIKTDYGLESVSLDQYMPEMPGFLREDLIVSIYCRFKESLQRYVNSGLGPYLSRLREEDAYIGRRIKVVQDGVVQLSGQCRGINEQGLMQIDTGQGIKLVVSGDLSIRPD